MIRVLVTGASGQLGSALLGAAGSFARLSLAACPRASLDLARPDAVEAGVRALDGDVVINCAAFNDTAAAERDARDAFTINARAVAALATACRARGIRLVHISTDYVFDGGKGAAYVERDARNPLNVYGASKALGEVLALRAHPDVMVVRTAALFGRRAAGTCGRRNFVDHVIARAAEGRPFEVVDDVTMSPTFAHDLAVMLLTLVDQRAEPGIYHGVNGGAATWYALARTALAAADADPALVRPRSAAADPSIVRPPYSVLANDRMREHVGPIRAWEDAVHEYVAGLPLVARSAPGEA